MADVHENSVACALVAFVMNIRVLYDVAVTSILDKRMEFANGQCSQEAQLRTPSLDE